MLLLATTAVLAALSLTSLRTGLPRINAVTVTTLVWVPLLGMAALPGALVPTLSTRTQVFLLVGVSSICVGALISALAARPRHSRRDVALVSVDMQRIVRVHILLIAFLLIQAGLQIYQALPAVRAAGGFAQLFNFQASSAGQFKIASVQALTIRRQETLTGGGIFVGIINYVSFLGFASLLTGAVLWNLRRRLLALIPLLLAGAYSFLSLQRTTFVISSLIMWFGIYSSKSLFHEAAGTRQRGFLGLRALPVATALAGLAVVLVPLQLRNMHTGRSTGAVSLFDYLLASVAGLNARFAAGRGSLSPPISVLGAPGPKVGLGAYTFTNLFALLHRLGWPVSVPPFIYDYATVGIAGEPFTTNTATSFYDFYLDAGWVGLAGMSLLIGAACSYMQMRPTARGRLIVLPPLAVLLTTVTWSFFVNVATRDIRYLFLAAFGAAFFARSSAFAGREVTSHTTAEGVISRTSGVAS